MTLPYGLLTDPSAIRRLLAEKAAQTTANTQAPPQGLMAPPMPVPTQPMPTPNPDPSAHVEQGGVRGGLMHLLGTDRVTPELGALLTPDQRERVKGGLLSTAWTALTTGRGAGAQQDARAMRLLALEDAKKARDLKARQDRLWANVQQIASGIRDPQEALEYTARMAAQLGLPQGEDAAVAAERLRPRQIQARANAKLTVLGADGNYYAIQQDATGAEVPGSRVRVPKPTAGITYREGTMPDGSVGYFALPSEESGDQRGPIAPRATGVTAPPDAPTTRANATMRRAMADNEASVSHIDDLITQLSKPGPEGGAAIGWKGYIPDAVLNRMFPQGVQTRSGLQNVGSLILHNRFGAALTKTELQRAGFIPFDTDSQATALDKLRKLKEYIAAETAALEEQAGPATPTSPAPAATGGKTITVNGKTFRIP